MIDEHLNKTFRQIFRYDKDIGHQFISNLNARIINENGGYYVRTNSLGFRSDIEFKTEKNNKSRILFFGDSNTASDGVSNNERFSELVGNHFNAEVYNYGLSGSGTDQQYLIWKKYAQNVKADLIVLCVLVENIERNKVAYRQTINPHTKKLTLTPKPYFDYVKNELVLKNSPVPRVEDNLLPKSNNMIQWSVPKGQEFIYSLVNLWRKSNIFKPIRENFEESLTKFRATLISNFYQPYPDYKKRNSKGFILTQKILNKFINDLSPTPVIILPIPTYHYYVDGAKPIYNNFFDFFENKEKKIFTCNILKNFKQLNLNQRKNLCFKKDKSHFSQFGHIKISDFLIKEIEKKNILINEKKNIENKITTGSKKPIYILGISAFYHDSAATLIKDGEIIASAQEERFSRVKNDRRFPSSAINFCLERASIQQTDLKAIVYYDNTSLTLERTLWSFLNTSPNSIKGWLKSMPAWVKYKFFIPQLIRSKLNYNGKIFQNLHHRSHAASAFFPSPFKRSAILTIDGVGEWATASIGQGDGNKIKVLKEMNYPNSLGLLYSAFTKFTGFKVNSGEYKMMGLAPYGNPIFYEIILKELIDLKKDGSIKINQEYFSYQSGSEMINEKFSDLFGGTPRIPDSKITQREMDIASSIQKVTEKIILTMARYVKKITGEDYLCLSGGVALNCVANGHLLKEDLFKDIWIQPASGDAGSSLGCALDFYHSYLKLDRKISENSNESLQLGSYLGPEWSDDEIKSFLETEDIKYDLINSASRAKIVAKLISEGNVIGHFVGRAEFGPRALGARSILGDPRNKDMQTTINLKIKRRESFRPFAPAVLAEKVNEYFDLNRKSPYMMLVAPILKKRRLNFTKSKTENMLEIIKQPRSDIPAITHIDYSARIQTIEKDYNRKFYDVVKEFDNLTGCAVVINTSFNVRGEPMVNTPMDAYKCFMSTEMDVLLLENFILYKSKQKNIKNNMNYNYLKNIENNSEKLIEKKLKKIYKNYFKNSIKIKNHQEESKELTFWLDIKNQTSLENIFLIEKELDTAESNPKKIAGSIIKYWYNKDFGRKLEPVIIDLLMMAKKYPIEDDINSKVSDSIYEMF